MNVFSNTAAKWLSVFVMLVLFALIQACAKQEQSEQGLRYLKVESAVEAIDQGVAVVDVRTDAEWDAGHLSSARHIPLSQLEQSDPGSILDPSQPVLVYCKSGGRASKAGQQLIDAGFEDVRVLKPGGFEHLAAAGVATESGANTQP